MDPIELLMSQYGMNRDEAEQIHSNLSQTGSAGGTISGRTSLGPKAVNPTTAPPPPAGPVTLRGRGSATRTTRQGGNIPAHGKQLPFVDEARRFSGAAHTSTEALRGAYPQTFESAVKEASEPAPQVQKFSGAAVTPVELGDPFETPAPVRYKAGEGQSGFRDDDMVRVLVDRYKVKPEAAVALADQIRAGKLDDENGIGAQADAMAQKREQRRTQLMQRYSQILVAAQNGEQVSDAEREWAGKVGRRIMELRQSKVQASARDAQAATETEAFNQQMARDEATDIEAGKQKRLADEATYERSRAEATASFARATQQQRLSQRAQQLSNSFGLDPASAMQLALQLEGAQ